MKQIVKGPEPRSLTEYRLTPDLNSSYRNFDYKDVLRSAIVAEQRGICCYCMGRIRDDDSAMKIDHWRCQRHYPDKQLDYRNMLGACLGGEGQPPRFQHCDTLKGDDDIKWNPADPEHQIESRVKYDPDGVIRAYDAEFDGHLNNVLNLNLPQIKNNRKIVLTAVLDWWEVERTKLRGPVPKAQIQREIQRRVGGDGELTPYCQIVVWWLKRKLQTMM